MSQGNPKVFICYRREETAAHAGRLYDAMVARFDERNVFMDVDLAPGVDFVERITEVVSACQVLIVVMGPNWATAKDEDGEARIADPDDFVRLEVETALKRPEVTPIPVLVSDARMPKREALPAELRPLTRRNALEMSNARWSYDVERLNNALDELLTDPTQQSATLAPQSPAPEPATPAPVPPESPTPLPVPPESPTPAPAPAASAPPAAGPSGARLVLEGVALAAVVAYLARWLSNPIPSPESDPLALASVVARRGVTWALTGAALAAWLAIRTGKGEPARLARIGLVVGALAGAVGGLVWAVPAILPDPNLDETDLAAANRIQIGALAVTGAMLGALIGWIWAPGRLKAGLIGGLAGGALSQLFLIGTGLTPEQEPQASEVVLTFLFSGAIVAGAVLATLTALDSRRAKAALPAPARGP